MLVRFNSGKEGIVLILSFYHLLFKHFPWGKMLRGFVEVIIRKDTCFEERFPQSTWPISSVWPGLERTILLFSIGFIHCGENRAVVKAPENVQKLRC